VGARADFVNTTTGPGDAELRSRHGTESSDPDVIAHDIEQTRAEMTGTVNEIQERLEPERLSAEAKEVAHYAIEEAKGAVQELANQASSAMHDATIGRVQRMTATTRGEAQSMKNDLFSTIKANPIPAAMAAVGIGWLWSHRASAGHESSSYGDMYGGRPFQAVGYGSPYYDAYGVGGMEHQSTASQAQQMAGQVASQVQERADQMQQQLGDTADQVQHRLENTAGQVQHQAQGFWQTLQANPIATAALGLGIGAVAGMAIPETEKEHEIMGETRDRVVGNVQQVAGEKLDQAQHIAADVGRTAMEEAKSQAKSQGMMSGSQNASSSPA
jgi:hypothetical protein